MISLWKMPLQCLLFVVPLRVRPESIDACFVSSRAQNSKKRHTAASTAQPSFSREVTRNPNMLAMCAYHRYERLPFFGGMVSGDTSWSKDKTVVARNSYGLLGHLLFQNTPLTLF